MFESLRALSHCDYPFTHCILSPEFTVFVVPCCIPSKWHHAVREMCVQYKCIEKNDSGSAPVLEEFFILVQEHLLQHITKGNSSRDVRAEIFNSQQRID